MRILSALSSINATLLSPSFSIMLSEDGGGTEDVVVLVPWYAKSSSRSPSRKMAQSQRRQSCRGQSRPRNLSQRSDTQIALKIVDATGPKTALMSILTDEFAKRFSSTTVSTSDGFDE